MVANIEEEDSYVETSFTVDEGNYSVENGSDYYYNLRNQDHIPTSDTNFLILHVYEAKFVISVILAVYLINLTLLCILYYATTQERRRIKERKRRENITLNSKLLHSSPSRGLLFEKILQFFTSIITLFLCWFTILLLFFPIIAPCVLAFTSVRFVIFITLKYLLGKRLHLASGNDTIWGSEENGQTSVITALYVLENEPNLDKIRTVFLDKVIERKDDFITTATTTESKNKSSDKRIDAVNYEKFKWSLKNYGGFFYWEEFENFSIEDHIKVVPESIHKENDVFDQLSKLADLPFESKYPPWEILLVQNFQFEDDEYIFSSAEDQGNVSSPNSNCNNTNNINVNRKYIRSNKISSQTKAHYSSGKFSASKPKSSPTKANPNTNKHASTNSNSTNKKSYYALIVRFHHAILDLVSAGLIFNYLVADKPANLTLNPFEWSKNRDNYSANNNCFSSWKSKCKQFYYCLCAFILSPLILLGNFTGENKAHGLHPHTKMNGPKFFTWLKPIPADDLKEIKRLTRANFSSILISAVGGAINELLTNRNEVKIEKTVDNNSSEIVSLHSKIFQGSAKRQPKHEDSGRASNKAPDFITVANATAFLPYYDINPTNRFSIMMTPVQISLKGKIRRRRRRRRRASCKPKTEDESESEGEGFSSYCEGELQSLKQVNRECSSIYGLVSIMVNFYAMKFIGYLPRPLIKAMLDRFEATATCINIPGPVESITAFDGDLLKDVVFWAPLKNTTAIGVNFFSYAGFIRTGILADYSAFQDSLQVHEFSQALHDQFYMLLKAARDASKSSNSSKSVFTSSV